MAIHIQSLACIVIAPFPPVPVVAELDADELVVVPGPNDDPEVKVVDPVGVSELDGAADVRLIVLVTMGMDEALDVVTDVEDMVEVLLVVCGALETETVVVPL